MLYMIIVLWKAPNVELTLTPITTYVLHTIKIPVGVIENIDRARKQFLWRGNFEKGRNLVAWDIVQQPKEKGGLSVVNM